uniref:Uncharacterized protein LOC113790867 n=1 Tax=Dermatophagoides pteronyssinus TaxID=6956 RepID=A0A6P6XSD4_DERPT|nr:uncharacterized protein LOC113790867 [Dermatophagoides pteronyssinus]
MFLDSEKYPLYQYDYGAAYIWQRLSLLGLLGIRTFYLQCSDTLSFQELYDCVVFNTDQYWKSRDSDENIQIKKSRRFRQYRQQFERNHPYLSILNPFANRLISFRVWLDSWLQMDHIDKKLFQQHNRMRLFPNSPIKTRNRAVLFILFTNHFNYSLLVTCIKLIFVIEAISTFHNVILLIQCALVLACSIIAPYLTIHGQMTEMNEKLIKLLEKIKYDNHYQITAIELKQLRFYLNEHTQLSRFVLYTDKITWSEALYYYALISIPINVTLMCELIVEDIIPETKFLFITAGIIHAVTGVFPFLLLADMSSDFHSINDYLPAMQLQLKQSKHLRLKIKYDDLYERLIHGKKIAHTFGTLGNLTFRGLFEAFFGYIAAFFLTLKVYMNEQQIEHNR